MSLFKTLPTTDKPRVLLIEAPPWFIAQVSLLFAEHDIAVTALSAGEFLQIDISQVELSTIYKIIWWEGFTKLAVSREILSKLRPLQRKIPIVITGRLPEELVAEPEKSSEQLTTKQQFFERLTTSFPTAQLVFARDLLEPNQLQEPLRFAFRGYSQNKLFDPRENWFLIDDKGFFKVISPLLIRPHKPQQILVQGQTKSSGQLLTKVANLLKLYYGDDYQILSVIAGRQTPQTPKFLKVAAPISLDDLLDVFVRNQPRWQAELENLTSFKPIQTLAIKKVAETVNEPARSTKTVVKQPNPTRGLKKKRLINQEKIINLSPSTLKSEDQLEEELARIFHLQRDEKKEARIEKKVKIAKKTAVKKRRNKLLFYVGVIAMILGGVTLGLWGIFILTTLFSKREILAFFEQQSTNSPLAYSPGNWSTALIAQDNLYSNFLDENWLGEGGELANLSRLLSERQSDQQTLARMFGQLFLAALGNNEALTPSNEELSSELDKDRQNLSQLLSVAENILGAENQTNTPNFWLESLKTAQQEQAILAQFPELFPEILGENGKRVYLVLLQDNLELRPTGGFIEAAALLVFDRGLLVDSQVIKVEELDNRLPGTVAAPAEVQRYLGTTNWYLRDSNWSPDFFSTAQRASWFVKEATGLSLDGVIAINPLILKDILSATGPMELPTFNETVTTENFLQRLEMHAAGELTNQLDQETYLAVFFRELLRQLPTLSQDEAFKVLAALQKNLQEKQLLMSLFSQEQTDALRKLGWSGEVITPVCPTQFSQTNCLVDQVFQTETNIGLNKINGYIQRSVTHQVDLTGQKVLHTRSLKLKNTARSTSWPLGDYKAYLRWLVDDESSLVSVTIDGRQLASDEFTTYGEGGREVIGVPVTIPPQIEQIIVITYTTENLPSEAFSYLLFDQKQAGLEPFEITTTLLTPDARTTLIAPQAEIEAGKLTFKLNQNQHLFMGANFQP